MKDQPQMPNVINLPPKPTQLVTIEGSIDYVLENEGGYSNDPLDHGGATNFGITQEDLSRYLKRSVTPHDVETMTRDTAVAIYRSFYWTPMMLSSLRDQKMATCIFDTGVLHGLFKGVKYSQLACNNSSGSSLDPDGHMGPKTLSALNAASRPAFIQSYHALVVDHFKAIVASEPSQARFMKGWMARADRLLVLS